MEPPATPARGDRPAMAIPVVEFSREGLKIQQFHLTTIGFQPKTLQFCIPLLKTPQPVLSQPPNMLVSLGLSPLDQKMFRQVIRKKVHFLLNTYFLVIQQAINYRQQQFQIYKGDFIKLMQKFPKYLLRKNSIFEFSLVKVQKNLIFKGAIKYCA